MSEPGAPAALLRGVCVAYQTAVGRRQAVSDIDLQLLPGEVLGVAGESGSGKTTVGLAMLGLLPRGATVRGSIELGGEQMVGASEKKWRQTRGRKVAMAFQETTTALNPLFRIEDQLTAVLRSNLGVTKAEARARAADSLRRVQLTDVERVMASYPGQLSGGMCQRVVIAMAVGCGSQVLIADEPTSALDVCVQKEVLDLMKHLVATEKLAILLISHDLSVLDRMCDRLMIMYRGETVEAGPTASVITAPQHTYTAQLLDAVPRLTAAS